MRKLIIVLGFISAILAVILAVTPLFKIAFIPGIAALIFGILALFLAKQKQDSKKSIQLVFLLTIIALGVTTYKSVFNTIEVGNIEDLQEKANESQEEAIKELEDLELNESDFE